MTTDGHLDLVRRQRDYAESEVHRLLGVIGELRAKPSEPGYTRIAAAIDDALKSADLRVELKTGTGSDWGRFTDSYDRELYVLARTLDKAGLIDWAAFAADLPARQGEESLGDAEREAYEAWCAGDHL